MKKIVYIIFLAILYSVVMIGCSNDDSESGISLTDSNDGDQKVNADDQTGGFTFIAKSTWKAVVEESNPTRSATENNLIGSNVSWLRLLINGEETYSGVAGTFTFTIEMDINYTGKARSASITIESGSDKITVTVNQGEKTKDGEIPKIPKLITQIVESATINSEYYNSDNPYEPSTFEFKYEDNTFRLKEFQVKGNYYGVNTFVYDYSILNEIRITENDNERYDGKLNDNGYIKEVSFPDTYYSSLSYRYNDNRYLTRVNKDYSQYNFEWDEGNLINIVPSYSHKENEPFRHNEEVNDKTNIDLNAFFFGIGYANRRYFGLYGEDETYLFALIDRAGKRSKNYLIYANTDVVDASEGREYPYSLQTEPHQGVLSTYFIQELSGDASYEFDAQKYPISFTQRVAVTKKETIYSGEKEYVQPISEAEREYWEMTIGPGPWFNIITTTKSYQTKYDTYKMEIKYNK